MARARGTHLFLCFVWVFIAVFDIMSDSAFAYFSVPFCLVVWGLTYLGVRDEETHPDTHV